MERDLEVVKRSGRDTIQVVIHICMETTQGISLYCYLYLKLAKNTMFLLSLMLFLLQNWRIRGWNRLYLEGGVVSRDMVQIMYSLVSKCKNDKNKTKK
jgi:hypothetical protein